MIDDGADKQRFGKTAIKKLKDICKYACEETGVEHSGFVIFDDNQEEGEIVAQYPNIFGLLHKRIRLKGVLAAEQFLRSDVPLVIPDVATVENLGEIRSLLLQFDIRSICIVKVRLHGKVIGSFSFESRGTTREFGKREIDLCRTFAVLASSEIERAAEDEWLKAFQQATFAINVDEEAPLLKAIIKQAELLFKAQTAGLYLRRPDDNLQDSLQLVASSTEELTGKNLRKGEGMAWQLILSCEPYMATSDYDQYDHRADFFEGTFGAVLEVPLLRQDERIGVLYLSDKKGRMFDERDATHLQEYADSAVIAIQHCNLVTRMRDISIASAEMFGNSDSESRSSRLTQIAQKATLILNAEMCGVFFRDKNDMLVLEASSGHRPEASNIGRRFEIKDEPWSGLTGALAARLIARHKKHIAESSPGAQFERRVINLCGETLLKDSAVKGGEVDASQDRSCHSLLAIPLIQKHANVEHVTGMLRISNKKGADGKPHNSICFDEQDRLILSVFAEAVVKALESAELSDERAEISKTLEQKNTLFLQLLGSAHEREANLKDLALYDLKCGILMHNQNQLVRNLKSKIGKLKEAIGSLGEVGTGPELLAMIKEIANLSVSLEELYRSTDGQIEKVLKSLKSLDEMLASEIHLRTPDVTKQVNAEYQNGDMVEVDEALIRYVFTVFCDNAVDAMKEVRCPKLLEIRLAVVGSWCSIRFSDSGTGIDPVIWQRIADQRSSPLDNWKQRKGLRSAFLAVEEFGGKIELIKTSKQGTTFEIRLPLVNAPLNAPRQAGLS